MADPELNPDPTRPARAECKTLNLGQHIRAYYQDYQLEDIAGFLRQHRPDVHLLQPLQDASVLRAFGRFYQTFHSAGAPRCLILGINPGRFGAGVTGVPFTDTIHLEQCCGIPWPNSASGGHSREISSQFIYRVIAAYGQRQAPLDDIAQASAQPITQAVARFYCHFLIESLLPLGFVRDQPRPVPPRQRKKAAPKPRQVNFNFYDDKQLLALCRPKIARHIQTLLSWGCRRDIVFCLGSGKNESILQQLNREFGFFEQIVALEHPRYIMQYQYGQCDQYIEKYCRLLEGAVAPPQARG